MGFNFIFLKNGLADNLIPEVSIESILSHPSNKEVQKSFLPIKDWNFIRT